MPPQTIRERARFVVDVVLRIATEVVTTLHAGMVLAVVEASIRWVPLPTLSRVLGCPIDLTPGVGGSPITTSHELGRRARRELRCTQRVSDAWPLSHGPCLRRALVGGHLLRRLGTRVRLGTYDQSGHVVAHAWLEIAGRPLEDVSNYRYFESVSSGPDGESHP